MIAWAAELSWCLEASFKGATVVDLKVKVSPVVLGEKKKKKKSTEHLILRATHSHPTFFLHVAFLN